MHVLEFLAPLQSYVVSKVLKLSQLLWRFIKHAIKHPIKTIFMFFKLWLCLMLFSLFAALAIAEEPNLDDLKSPKFGAVFTLRCGVQSSSPTVVSDSRSGYACHPIFLADINKLISAHLSSGFYASAGEPSFSSESNWSYTYVACRYGDCGRYGTDGQKTASGQDYATVINESTDYSCPPEGAPLHTIPVPTGNPTDEPNFMCAKPLFENECPEPTESDPYIFGTAVSPTNVCYDNPEKENSQCNISTDDTGGYYLPTKYGSQEPVNCEAPPKGSDPDGEADPEDQFCYVYGTNGIYSADCPTTSISFDITGIQKNADQLVVNHERFQEIENSMISQTQIDELLESGELKGEKGDKGDRGERGLMGTQGLQGIQGVAGAAGADGSDGVDGIDGQNGEDGKDGKDGINGVDGADGLNGSDGADGADGRDGTNGVDGQDGQDGEDGEDGENCSVVNTNNGAVISCPDGSSSEVEGIDTDAVVSELVKQTNEIKKQTEEISKIGTYDGDAPKIDYTTRPEKYNEIANFDWENNNFGTVLEEHNDAMRNLPLFAAIDDFFVTSFGGNCPVWSETVTVLDASFNITFDQFCSSAVQSILPAIRAILMLIAGFFAWRIAIE